MRFIEQFYYGNIEPQERSTKPSKAIKKQMEILVKGEGLFTELLDDELKKCFLEYVNAWHEVNSESNLDSFIMGFRLGAGFAYDTFISNDTPFTGYTEEE